MKKSISALIMVLVLLLATVPSMAMGSFLYEGIEGTLQGPWDYDSELGGDVVLEVPMEVYVEDGIEEQMRTLLAIIQPSTYSEVIIHGDKTPSEGDAVIVDYRATTGSHIIDRIEVFTNEDAPTETTTQESQPSEWAAEYVQRAKDNNIATEATTQDYQENITREEFAEVILNLYNAVAGTPGDLELATFKDTDNIKIQKAAALGLIEGVGDNRFVPNNLVTREQMAVMYDRLLVETDNVFETTLEYVHFADEDKISDWAKSSVQTLYKLEIIQGVGENEIGPLVNATKEQALVLSIRLFDLINQ